MDASQLTHSGRVALVTGAAGALGAVLCVELAGRGTRVIGVDVLDAGDTGDRVEASGGGWLGIQADLTAPDEVAGIVSSVDERFGRLDILVNNAGIMPTADIVGHNFALWRKALSVNLDAAFLTMSLCLPLMKKNRWGRIVNVVSSSVELPTGGRSAYKASKMGLVGLTRGAAVDVADWGIRVNAVSPPFMRTPILGELGADYQAGIVSRQAIKRMGTTQDAIGLIVFLTGDDAEFITGQTYYADGGLTFG